MGLFLLIFVVLSLVSLGFLMPAWTPAATGVYVALWIMFGGASLWIWKPTRSTERLLRLAAGVLGVLMTVSMIDFLIAQVASRQAVVGGRTPLVGFFVIGLPAMWFALRGFKEPLLDDQNDESDSDSDLLF